MVVPHRCSGGAEGRRQPLNASSSSGRCCCCRSDLHGAKERRATRRLPQADLTRAPCVYAAATRDLDSGRDSWILWSVALNNGDAGMRAAPQSADRLHHERDSALRRALIGKQQASIGRHDANQAKSRQIKGLGSKCSADKDLRSATTECVKDAVT